MSKAKHAVVEEKGESAPLWIISFADMISLLMAFFVMLLTMSTEKSGLLCNEGTGVFGETVSGFRAAIQGFGMPGMVGSANDGVKLDKVKVYYAIGGKNEPNALRTIDAAGERARRVFRRLEGRTRTYGAQVRGKNPDFFVLPMAFPAGQSVLTESALRSLNGFAADLKGSAPADGMQLYVVGLAPDVVDERQQWLVSARRSQVVADFLQDRFPSGTHCRIFAWGAAAGGDWVKKGGPISQPAHIAIALLKPGD